MAQSPVPVADSSAPGNIAPLRASFLRHLHAENRSPSTRTTYAKAIDQLDGFLLATGMPSDVADLTREHIEHFLVSLQERGMRPATVSQRYRSLQQFFRWLAEEGEIRASPMAKMRPPHVPEEPPAVLTEDELRRLLKACEGTDRFHSQAAMGLIGQLHQAVTEQPRMGLLDRGQSAPRRSRDVPCQALGRLRAD